MYFDFRVLSGKQSYKIISSTIVPRPIAWVVTCDGAGRANAAPFSFFNAISGDPPVVCLSIGNTARGQKDTLKNILANGELVINMVSEENVEAMNTTAIPFEPNIDELALAGIESCASSVVRPHRIAASPASFECRVREIIPIGPSNTLVLANVVAAHIRDNAVTDAELCRIDTSKLDLVGRSESPGWYVRTRDRFLLRQMSVEDFKASQSIVKY